MWKRNLLFLGLLLGAAATLWANLLSPRIVAPRTGPTTTDGAGPGRIDGDIVARVDESFREGWSRRGLFAGRDAPELAVLRRLSLALTGTIPSLEEIRRFEAMPAGRRLES